MIGRPFRWRSSTIFERRLGVRDQSVRVANISESTPLSGLALGHRLYVRAPAFRRCKEINRGHHGGTETQSKSFLFRICASVSLWFATSCRNSSRLLRVWAALGRPFEAEGAGQPPCLRAEETRLRGRLSLA